MKTDSCLRGPKSHSLAFVHPAAAAQSHSPPTQTHRSYFFNGYLFFYICQYTGHQDPTPGAHARATRTGRSSSQGGHGDGGPVLSTQSFTWPTSSESAAGVRTLMLSHVHVLSPDSRGQTRLFLECGPALRSGQELCCLVTGSGCPWELSPRQEEHQWLQSAAATATPAPEPSRCLGFRSPRLHTW